MSLATRRGRKKSKAFIRIETILCLILCIIFGLLYMSKVAIKRDGPTNNNSPHFISLSNIRGSGGIISNPSDVDTGYSNAVHDSANLDGAGDTVHSDGIRYHLIFSTDCSAYQHWQSYLLFYRALKVGQPGRVTRIASGCKDDEAEKETLWHNTHIKNAMSDRFSLHLTPHFSGVKNEDGTDTGKDYEFFNKPFGLKHWMENGEYIQKDGVLDEDAVVILIDPDMVLLRPITIDFSNDEDTIFGASPPGTTEKVKFVQKGVPFATKYGFGGQWHSMLDLAKIAGPSSPAIKVSNNDAENMSYGPPYIGFASDMLPIARKWSEFVPGCHAQYPYLLAEMFAYCVAAAHLELGHQVMNSLMISDVDMNRNEGWEFIDKVSKEDACDHGNHLSSSKYPLPNVLHFCQRYMIGDWFYGKKRLPKDFFTCESPLIEPPPLNVATLFDYFEPPPPHPRPGERKPLTPRNALRTTFVLCAMTSALNEASEYFKQNACQGNKDTNMNKSLNLWHMLDKDKK